MGDLRAELQRIDGRPYPAYRDLRGRTFVVGPWRLTLEHVQGDPFASPSRLRVDVPASVPRLAEAARRTADARRAAADFLHRALAAALGGRQGGGSGRSGFVDVAAVGQEVLERTAVRVLPDGALVLRLTVGLPAAGRRILGREAATVLAERLPRVLDAAVGAVDAPALEHHVAVVEDQVALRAQLAASGLVAFVAEGSRLARRSGSDDRPFDGGVPLAVPDALACTLDAPHAGRLRGLGIAAGVTVIVGGGYHGKSTLLDALARGVYDHVPGDGRERCVTVGGAVSVRAEDGRPVRGVDLRPFIGNLPLGRSTECFETDDASGSTSQAANIVEALEAGATALLVDEDTAATNFMVRDARMRRLVPGTAEPITPFLDRVRQLATERCVSSVLVVGGAGDWLDVADRVIRMTDYEPADVTAAARAVAAALPLGAASPQAPGPWPTAAPRRVDPVSLEPHRGGRPLRVRARRTNAIEVGDTEVDVSALAQLVDPAQCRMIGDALLALAGTCDGRRSVAEVLDLLEARIAASGLEAITAPGFGDRARARRFEVAAALNRLPGLRLRHG
ncbi:MAG: ABC-ATPase domain-containing protein [Candidatus Binatia bacterium]